MPSARARRGARRLPRSRRSSSAAARRPSPLCPSCCGCSKRCRRRRELTVEANPETVTPELARALRAAGVDRVSLGAQTFQPRSPARARAARRRPTTSDAPCAILREAGFDNISLDLIYGIPARAPTISPPTSTRRSRSSRSTSPATSSRRSRARASPIAWGAELERQAEAIEDYFERVVATPDRRRLPLVRDRQLLPRRRKRTSARGTTSPTGSAATTSGSGSARCRHSSGERRRNTPKLAPYLRRATTTARSSSLDDETRARERVMLGLRLDEPLPLDGLRPRSTQPASRAPSSSGSRSTRARRSRSPGAAASSAAASQPRSSPDAAG